MNDPDRKSASKFQHFILQLLNETKVQQIKVAAGVLYVLQVLSTTNEFSSISELPLHAPKQPWSE
jgi:hypothetical protein